MSIGFTEKHRKDNIFRGRPWFRWESAGSFLALLTGFAMLSDEVDTLRSIVCENIERKKAWRRALRPREPL
jgi:hypothetical protein